jgi:hypothetical protein
MALLYDWLDKRFYLNLFDTEFLCDVNDTTFIQFCPINDDLIECDVLVLLAFFLLHCFNVSLLDKDPTDPKNREIIKLFTSSQNCFLTCLMNFQS